MFVPHQPPRPSSSSDTPFTGSPAMLVRLTNTKQQDVWVNPIHVRVVRWSGKHTEVVIDPMYLILKIAMPMDDVAALLDAGGPPAGFAPDSPPPPAD